MTQFANSLSCVPSLATLNVQVAVVRSHSDSVLALRIFFSICLIAVFFAGYRIFKNRKKLFGRDPQVIGDHYGARNLRLWQVILVWILAVELLIAILWRL
jgi:hypothetical protein